MPEHDEKGRFVQGNSGGGRKSVYTEELGEDICARLADGETLNSICKEDRYPDERAVRSWALDPEHPFSPKYIRAREIGYMRMADELLEISDDGSNDWMERSHGDDKESSWQINGEHVQRSRLRLDTRKWLLSKALPKVFGDKVSTELTGKDGGPIETKVSELEAAQRVAFMLGEALAKLNAGGTET